MQLVSFFAYANIGNFPIEENAIIKHKVLDRKKNKDLNGLPITH